MFCAPTVGVRIHRSFDAVLTCEGSPGGVLEPEPEELIRAIEDLARMLSEPEPQAQRFTLQDTLRAVMADAAHQVLPAVSSQYPNRCGCEWRTDSGALGCDSVDRPPSPVLSEWVSGYLLNLPRCHALGVSPRLEFRTI
jgi:hypothetical protein